ncbi:hypothetical protein HG531_001616 [Fusarium graminearum]|nr:hypothetical protein HG531_001616 [Fusarium graminearum]
MGAKLLAAVIKVILVTNVEEVGVMGLGLKDLALQLANLFFGGVELGSKIGNLSVLLFKGLLSGSFGATGLFQFTRDNRVAALEVGYTTSVFISELSIGAGKTVVNFAKPRNFVLEEL